MARRRSAGATTQYGVLPDSTTRCAALYTTLRDYLGHQAGGAWTDAMELGRRPVAQIIRVMSWWTPILPDWRSPASGCRPCYRSKQLGRPR